MNKSMKVLTTLALSAIFCAALAGPGWAGVTWIDVPEFVKTVTYPMEDSYGATLDPNVLFLLDTGSPMVMSPLGRLPTVDTDLNPWERAAMLADCTYGAGGRPFNENAANNFTRFGRDLIASNNIIGDPFCYYTPDPAKPYFLTFKDRNWANWNGTGAPPNDVNGVAMPSNLRAYLPGGGSAGSPVPLLLANQYLVTNDSRMYQMKLVL